ncbi:MAG TPA: TfoX/Sxy family protein [Actinomycetota bacterium]|nr:TfoX/Sxy family protein [Actinomycetota bacterium]
MAYDEDLADRIRVLLDGEPGVVEKKMFGGLAFLIGGHLAVSASGHGGILVRVDPADTDQHLASSTAEVAVMRGRPMDGWLRVAPGDLRTKQQLGKWVRLGIAHARSLPPR